MPFPRQLSFLFLPPSPPLLTENGKQKTEKIMKRCTVCAHPAKDEIDRDLQAGVPYRTLAAQHGLSASALFRHTKHLARALTLASDHHELTRRQAILDKLELLEIRLDRLFHNAQDFRSLHVALGCVQESVRVLALQERIRQSTRLRPGVPVSQQ